MAFIEKVLCLLAFSVLALWRTPVRRRMQERKIYLPFSKSPSVSRLSRHAEDTIWCPFRCERAVKRCVNVGKND